MPRQTFPFLRWRLPRSPLPRHRPAAPHLVQLEARSSEPEPNDEDAAVAAAAVDRADRDGRRGPGDEAGDAAEVDCVDGDGEEDVAAPSSPGEIPSAVAWRRRRRRIVLLYFVTVALLFADMNLMAPNLTEIGEEFGFTEDERDVKLGGLIALAFFFIGAPVSFAVGWLADSVRRSPLYGSAVFFGEAACLGTYFVQTYPQLFVTRTMTGIGVGGSVPVMYSVLGDLYPATQRNAVSAVVYMGAGLGAGVGQALAGFLGERHGWRLPFLVVSVPGLVCSLFLFCLEDPERGGKEAARMEMDAEGLEGSTEGSAGRRVAPSPPEASGGREEGPFRDEEAGRTEALGREAVKTDEDGDEMFVTPPRPVQEEKPHKESRLALGDATAEGQAKEAPNPVPEKPDTDGQKVSWKTTWEMLCTPSVALTICQAAPGALPFGFCSVFLNDYLQEERGMTKEEATGVLLTFGVGNALGVIAGGVLGHKAYKRDPRGPPLIMGLSLLLSCVPMYFLVNRIDGESSAGYAAAVGIFAGGLATLPVPMERAVLSNVTEPRSRGRANAVLSVVDDLGKGLGPALVSILIVATERRTAMNFSLLGWAAAGMLSLCIMRFVREDEQNVQERVRRELMERGMQNAGGEREDAERENDETIPL